MDIYDIPISKITKDFFEYINLIEQLDLEVAGDFIFMAASLMQIKARMLLPKEIDEKGEEIDPRADLVAALLEYKRYKEMSEEFSFLESSQRKLKFRGNFEKDEKEAPADLDTALRNVTIYDLVKVYKKAIAEKPKEVFHEVKKINVTIDEQMNHILENTKENRELSFVELVSGMNEKIRIIVTFIAILEMIKMGKIGLRETHDFNDFMIYGLENG